MNIIKPKYTSEDYGLLYRELEERYGPFLAQELVDQIRRVEQPGWKPDYMAAKALSEVLDDIRLHARNTVRRLKVLRHETETWPEGVACLHTGRAERDLERVMPLYWIVMHGYYTYVESGLAFYRAQKFTPARHSELARAA